VLILRRSGIILRSEPKLKAREADHGNASGHLKTVRRQLVRSALLASVAACIPAMAGACLVCIDVPEDSLADRAIEAEVVALLRPSPNDPFRYVPVAFLKGGPAVPAVPFLVSRPAAMVFASDPSAVTVAVIDAGGGWALHDQGSHDLGEVLRLALASDLTTPEARLAFFGPLVVHPDLAVQQMALIEMATLPYSVLRGTVARPSRREVASRAFDVLWAQWAPVMILLLGTSDDPEDARFVRAAVGRLAASGHDTHLAAWVTALIEVDGVAALDHLQHLFPDRSEGSVGTFRALSLALGEHAARRDQVGDAALADLARLVETRPEGGGYLARVMLEREDWSGAARLARLRETGRIADPADAFIIDQYLAAAADAAFIIP
jgi:hypothetical protein